MADSPLKLLRIKRYPATTNASLKAWDAADELLVSAVQEHQLSEKMLLCNDRFGYLSVHFHANKPAIIINSKSQEKAIKSNLEGNKLSLEEVAFQTPLDIHPNAFAAGAMKLPKSLDLFELQLQHYVQNLEENATLLCGFMTRHFSPKMLTIAANYFEEVGQSKAVKKARLLFLKKPKQLSEEEKKPLFRTLTSQSGQDFQQYYGVFSGNHIDFASELFIAHMNLKGSEENVLDLASGNGILAHAVRQQLPEATLHLLDDDWLAVASSKFNLTEENTHFHCADNLEDFDDHCFDLVVCNPPFHFGYETNTEVSIQLFKDVKRCLKPGGSFQLVANRHLPYWNFLKDLFNKVELLGSNEKFCVYECT